MMNGQNPIKNVYISKEEEEKRIFELYKPYLEDYNSTQTKLKLAKLK